MIATLIYGIISGIIIGLIALAFQINYKAYNMLDLSLAGIYVVASYSVIFLTGIFKFQSSLISFSLAILISCLLIYILSFLIFHLVYRKFLSKKSSSMTLLVVSLSIYIILINTISIIFGPEIQIFEIKGVLTESNEVGTIVITSIHLFQITLSILLIVTTLYILNVKRIGTKLNAIFDNVELFSTLGHDKTKTRNIVLIISTILIVSASALKTLEFGIELYTTGFNMLLLGAIAMLIGGVHSYKGSLFGGIFLGVISNLVSWNLNGEWQEAVTFIILIIVLIFKRKGFFSIDLRTAK